MSLASLMLYSVFNMLRALLFTQLCDSHFLTNIRVCRIKNATNCFIDKSIKCFDLINCQQEHFASNCVSAILKDFVNFNNVRFAKFFA